MPIELQIIKAAEFVCAGPRGQLDFASSKEMLATLARACRKRGLDCALLDLRSLRLSARPIFTPAELARLVRTFREVGFGPQQSLAVLYASDPHHGARTFAFISRLRGWRVRAFHDFESAFLWFSAAKNSKRPAREEWRIPIQIDGTGNKTALTVRDAPGRTRSAERAR